MFKKVLMTGLMITVMLSASACGKDSVGTSGTVADTPVESPSDSQPTEAPQSTEAKTQGTSEESPQPTEEPVEEVSASWIFSEMPIAAYEVTGLGVGPDEEVYAEKIIDPEDGYDYGVVPFVKQTPENTFTLYCVDIGVYRNEKTVTIHSPSGGSQWEGHWYTCLDISVNPMPEGYSELTKQPGRFVEETVKGKIFSLMDPWTEYVQFSEILHPDAPQSDVIFVIEIKSFPGDGEYKNVDEVLTGMVKAFEHRLGATVQEVSVEEAMARDNIVVSEGDAD